MGQSVRRILVCLDGSPEGLHLGRDAAGLARRLDAELVALWGLRRPSPSPAETFARGAGPIREVLEHQAAGEEALVSAARAAFAELTASLDLRTDFRAAWDSASDPLPPALPGDLLVVAQPRLPGQPDTLAAGRLLLTSERPVLVRTEGGDLGLRGPVLICWNGSPAARRALEDAVPLIPAPGLATLLVVDGAADRRGARDAAAVLRAAGFDVAVRSVASGAASVAETIAAEAERLDAGLIVLGGYSRSPTLERIFGGVTRSFLVAAPRPLLLSHVPPALAHRIAASTPQPVPDDPAAALR